MKRLILMGGRPWVTGDNGKTFTDALFRYFPREIKIAFCIFAQPESEWEETEKWNTKMFDSFRGNRTLHYKIMTTGNFADVAAWADVIYMPGGHPGALLETLNACGNVTKLWDGKVIAGSSAGADIMCTQYVYLQDKSVAPGLGWLPVSCIPHWRDYFDNYTDEDWDWAEKTLLEKFPHLPVITIPEGEFTEFSVA